jgi:hypothetical protein
VSGCAGGLGFSLSDAAPGVTPEEARASRCAGWAAIRPTIEDVDLMSDDLAAQILAHNLMGVDLGCWSIRP